MTDMPHTDRDAWARLTPYEVGIPGRTFADENCESIREEAEKRGVDATDPGAFLMLGQVGRVLREIQGGERGADALQRFGAFLFHAFHFHRAGEPLLLLATDTLRSLVEGWPGAEAASADSPDPDWAGQLPAEAGYLQLPRHLVWSHPDPEGPAEDLDGVFWTRSTGDTLSLMPALGVRADRPGISVVPLPPLPLADAGRWLEARARDEGQGADFQTTLPGGDLDRLYSVVTAGEVLKLVARVFHRIHTAPEVVGAEERAPHPDELAADPGSGTKGARPSLLPFRRVG